jgi:DNA (cytosine-5)-methyltransferase 1
MTAHPPEPKLKVLSLFAGIGGFELGLERTGGFETVAQCEIDPFCRKVLAKHWPKVKRYEDVRTLTADTLRRDGIDVDVICGGFPCQDISGAGNQAGMGHGTRSGLWGEIVRIAREVRPKIIIVENVSNLLAGPSERPGAWFGRVWVVAYSNGFFGQQRFAAQPLLRQSHLHEQSTRSFARWPGRSNLPKPRTCRGNDGVSSRLHALGNAVVPQIPELIGNAILEARRAS